MKVLKNIPGLIIFAVVLYTLIGFQIYTALNTPDVIFSWETKKCVKVEMPDGTDGDCNNLPEKYNMIWGK